MSSRRVERLNEHRTVYDAVKGWVNTVKDQLDSTAWHIPRAGFFPYRAASIKSRRSIVEFGE